MTRSEIVEAVSKAWCTEENQEKELDPELLTAIVNEIVKLTNKDRVDKVVCKPKEVFCKDCKHYHCRKILGFSGMLSSNTFISHECLYSEAKTDPVSGEPNIITGVLCLERNHDCHCKYFEIKEEKNV